MGKTLNNMASLICPKRQLRQSQVVAALSALFTERRVLGHVISRALPSDSTRTLVT